MSPGPRAAPAVARAVRPPGGAALLRGVAAVAAVAVALHLLAASQLSGGAFKRDSCMSIAQRRPPPKALLAAWRPESRPLPPAEPPLTPTNWLGPVNKAHLASTRAEIMDACGYHIFRYRVLKRRVYVDEDHNKDKLLLRYREVFAEMLLTAIWLYRDFPDVDLWVNTADEPTKCSLQVPVLQFYVVPFTGAGSDAKDPEWGRRRAAAAAQRRAGGGSGGGGAAAGVGGSNSSGSGAGGGGGGSKDSGDGTMADAGGADAGLDEALAAPPPAPPVFALDQLLSGSGGWPGSSGGSGGGGAAPAFTRGYPIVTADTWEDLSLPPESLAAYTSCLRARYSGRRVPQAVWRGSNTGFNRGWPAEPPPPSAAAAAPDAPTAVWAAWRRMLYNKRALASLMSRDVPYMDVGLHAFIPEIWDLKGHEPAARAAQELLVKPAVPIEEWSRYAVQLSLDGHGGPFRLPRQYLSGTTVVLQMQSPLLSWFADSFVPGQHYVEFSYDLSDLLPKAQLLTTAAARSEASAARLGALARRAAEEAARVFGVLSQLDSLAWAAGRVRDAAGPPAVKGAPAGGGAEGAAGEGWRLLKLRRGAGGEGWKSAFLAGPGMAGFRRSFADVMRDNLAH